MKILIINTFYYPNLVGGCEHSVKLLAENLAKQNDFEVAIYSIDSKLNSLQIQDVNGVKIYRGTGGYFNAVERLKPRNERRFFIKLSNFIFELYNPFIKSEFNKILDDFKPDVVHTNNIFGLFPYVWSIAKKRNIKIVHTLRDYWLLSSSCDIDTLKNSCFYFKIFNLIRLKWMKVKCSNNVDVVTAPSNAVLDIFKDYRFFKNSEFKRIYNAVTLDIKEVHQLKNYKLKKMNEIFVFVFVGNLYKNKGILNLIDAFCDLKLSKSKLYIIGDGPLYDKVQQIAKYEENIVLFGKKSQIELQQILKKADIMVVPSLWKEPFGRVVIEANLNMIPVIGSNRGGIPEIINEIGGGVIFDADNVNDLKSKMLYFYKNRDFNKYFVNIENNIEQFSAKYQINQFVEIYKQRNY